MRPTRPRARGVKALHDEVLAHIGLGNHKLVDVEIVVVLGVGDGGLERLLDVAGDARREKVRSASAVSTFLPRMIDATSLSFCGLTRRLRVTAGLRCLPATRCLDGLPIGYFLFAFLSAPWP
jgi:hypothetical protein